MRGCPGRGTGGRLLLAIMIAIFNQLSGINAILYYLNDIFASRGVQRRFCGSSGDRDRIDEPDIHRTRARR